MNIVNYFRNFFNRIRKGNNPMLLDSPKELYSKLIDEKKISSILENIPEHFTDLEKAYYIYIELGKILNENPKFVFGDRECKREHYNDEIDEKYLGICKSISELYVSVLAKIGIQADLVKENPNSPISHIDTVLKIDGKNYIANLIGDLGRIKTGSRINYFGYNLARENGNSAKGKANREYLVRLEKYYGKMDYLRRRDIEQFDKKLGYSFFVPQFTREDERGIYTEDTFELLKRDFDNPEIFKEHVLHGEDVKEEEILQYKLDFIFENIDKFSDYNGKMGYLENIRYYMKIAQKLLTPEEISRLCPYVAVKSNNMNDIISILKVLPLHLTEKRGEGNIYYLYSQEDNKYKRKTAEEMKDFIYGINKDSLRIVGMFDRYAPQSLEELEL